MLTLNDGRSELWQWDTGRKLTVDADCTQVHFSNKFFGRSVDVDVVDGVAEIPDVLLQADKELLVWAFVGTAENGYTKISKVFKVNKRNKPADYVFTPTEQTTLDEIMKRLDRIEEGQDPDAIKNAVDEYLANNPIQVEEKDPTVPDWAKEETKPKYTAQEVGAVATVNGQTPDENGNVEIKVSEQNINPVPKTDDMTQPVGVDADGRLWVAPIGGGPGGGDTPVVPGSHGIIWNLVNVTSSNPVASINHGEALTAVLTPAEGYTLGDVNVTMGGEVLTGAWNADTATVTIASVTGDVVISCAGVEQVETLDTSPVIEVEGSGITSLGYIGKSEYWGYTKFYEVSDTSVTVFVTNTEGVKPPSSNAAMLIFCTSDAPTNPMPLSGYHNSYGTNNLGVEKTKAITDEAVIGLRMTLLLAEKENAYVYETNTGKVIFAGTNTPYYGMANISGASAAVVEELSYDDDVAQNYSIATTSILGEETATDTSGKYGISSDLAAVIDEVRTAWMIEYGGDPRKIPLIITTDQHGRTNAGIFNMLGKTLSLHDVSKICNLGDTCAVEWVDADADHPLLSCSALENWCESIKAIPFSKRLDVYGNHDAWYYDGYSVEGNTVGTRYPATMHHLDQYFRNIYARRNNNHGWGAIRDDYFNVKYLIVTGFEFKNGTSASRISTAQMKNIIAELSMDDGYDIVIMSHMPLHYQVSSATYPTGMNPEDTTTTGITRFSGVDTDTLFNARKNKTSGTITDSDGVEHSFDFSSCTTEILCGLNGHMHLDAYNHIGGDGLANMTFDWFDGNTVHFVLIDRKNRQINVWKMEGTALSYTNYQVPLDKPTE